MAIMLARRSDELESSIVRELLSVGDRPGMRSLAGGLPDPALFPAARLAAACATVLGDAARAGRALQYGPTPGLGELREALTHAPLVQRLPSVEPDDLVVTTGSQQALDLLARVLVDAGDTVAVDDPCYLGARQAFTAAGARLAGVPLDADGMRVDVLADRLRAGLRPRFVYTVPAFQNPTGAVLAPKRARELVELAREYGFVIVEDDAYGALGFDGAAPVPMGVDAPDVVITTGTVSKVLAPGLRIGWLRAPAPVRAAVVRAKQAGDLHTSTLNQLLVADVLADDAFVTAHVAGIRASYAPRARALAAAVGAPAPRGGLFAWARLAGVDTQSLLDRAIAHDVMFVPGGAFAIEESWFEHVRLSFATLPTLQLLDAARALLALV